MANNEIRHQFTSTPSSTRTALETAKGRAHRQRTDDIDLVAIQSRPALRSRRAKRQRHEDRNTVIGGTLALGVVALALAMTGHFKDSKPEQANRIPKRDAIEYVVPNTESPLTLADQLHKPNVDPLTLASEIQAQVGNQADAGEAIKLDKRQVVLPPQPNR